MSDTDHSKSRTEEIHNMITSHFPAYPYDGIVMRAYHPPSVYEAEADDLNTLLKGKTWRDLYPEYVTANEDDYLLMNDAAVVAFLGAWLWRAAEDIDGPNEVRDALIFSLATFGSELWGNTFRSLNLNQRNVIHALLECTAQFAHGEERALIEKALRGI